MELKSTEIEYKKEYRNIEIQICNLKEMGTDSHQPLQQHGLTFNKWCLCFTMGHTALSATKGLVFKWLSAAKV